MHHPVNELARQLAQELKDATAPSAPIAANPNEYIRQLQLRLERVNEIRQQMIALACDPSAQSRYELYAHQHRRYLYEQDNERFAVTIPPTGHPQDTDAVTHLTCDRSTTLCGRHVPTDAEISDQRVTCAVCQTRAECAG